MARSSAIESAEVHGHAAVASGATAQGRKFADAARAWRSRVAYLLAAVVVLGTALRCQAIGTRSLWFDEAFSWRLSQGSIGDVIARSARDNHPPLHFLALKAWRALFGESPVSLRSLSVFSGAIAVVGVYLLMREAWPGPRNERGDASQRVAAVPEASWAGLLAAALVAVNVFQVRWGWEARMYALGAALAALSSWAMFRALHTRRRLWAAWSLYGALALLFAYTHVYALFSVAAQFVFLAGCVARDARWRPSGAWKLPYLRPMLAAMGLFAIGFLAWLPFLLRQRSQVRADFWSEPIAAWDIPNVCYRMLALPEDGPVSHAQAAWAAAFCGAVLLPLLWRPRAIDWYLVLAAAMPFALSVLVSMLDTKIFHLRYFVFAGLFFCVAAARLAARIPDRFLRGVIAVALAVNALAATIRFCDGLDLAERPGVRAACQYVLDHGGTGEPVIVASPFFYLPACYHLGGARECYLLGELGGVRHYEGAAALEPDDFISADKIASLQAQRVWAINDHSGQWEALEVKMPDRWGLASRRQFREAYGVQGTVELAEYIERHGAPNRLRTPRRRNGE